MKPRTVHATYVFYDHTLCGLNSADVIVREHGSLGWEYVTCEECLVDIERRKAMDEAERIASRRFCF